MRCRDVARGGVGRINTATPLGRDCSSGVGVVRVVIQSWLGFVLVGTKTRRHVEANRVVSPIGSSQPTIPFGRVLSGYTVMFCGPAVLVRGG